MVVLPAEAGEKHFGFEERVKLVQSTCTPARGLQNRH
ncbi:hypothetical protein ACV56Z_02290 [Staphylococcus aureus]